MGTETLTEITNATVVEENLVPCGKPIILKVSGESVKSVLMRVKPELATYYVIGKQEAHGLENHKYPVQFYRTKE